LGPLEGPGGGVGEGQALAGWLSRRWTCYAEGWGLLRLAARKKRQVRIAWLDLSRQSTRPKSHSELSLVQSCGLERLVDVAPLTADSMGDLGGAHSFLAQRYDACAVESGRAALVNPLRLRGVNASAPISLAESAPVPTTMAMIMSCPLERRRPAS
jgi:hypothetical protein